MKRAIVLAMALSLGLSLVLIEKAQADPAKGKAAFATYCASCHGNTGKGDGPAGAALNPKPKDLGNAEYASKLTDQYMTDIIKKGGTAVGKSALMPPWGTALKDDDIKNVIEYIRSLSKK